MLLFALDPDSATPAFAQIRDRVIGLIDAGTLGAGDRLPPTRAFAADLGVHRSTVVRAYDEIRALGYLESRSGSYTTIRRRVRLPAEAGPAPGPGRIDWSRAVAPAVRALHRLNAPDSAPADPGPVDLERVAADPRLAPAAELRRCVRYVLKRHAGEALDYAPAQGLLSLREVIARRLGVHGVDVPPDGILVTGGAQQAIDLVLRLLLRPGDAVAVGAPTYGMMHALLRLHGARPIEIPMRATGLDLDRLARILRRRPPRLIYTMPNFHNPTGVTTAQDHRERLLDLAVNARVPVLEDGFEEEMKYFGRAVLPLKSMDAHGIVLYVGTFSKVVFPGLRLGWIAAPPEAVQRLAAIQRASCLSGNTLAQATAARFCASGEFEVYLRRVHREYRKRMLALLDGLQAHLPRHVSWTRPIGGYTVWLEMPDRPNREDELYRRALESGVRMARGSRFFARAPRRTCFRLSIACATAPEITEGCRRLGAALA